jgi:uncharacterized protein (TIGR00645 family)
MVRFIERVLLASRWLLAPLYLGLALLLLFFVAEFFIELADIIHAVVAQTELKLTLAALRLLDLVLVASLIVMVMISGFENFVARIELGDNREGLAWLTRLDTGSIKVKIMGSVAVISGIYLLEVFFTLDGFSVETRLWLVVLHLTFVVTAVLLALLDRLGGH